MLKKLDIIRKALFVLFIILIGASYALAPVISGESSAALANLILAVTMIVALGLGGVLYLFCKGVANRIGLGLVIAVVIYEGTYVFQALTAEYISAEMVLKMVGLIMFAVSFVVAFIEFLVRRAGGSDDPEEDPRIQKVLAWKKLADEGIISKEEYEEKRVAILSLKKENKQK